MYKVNVYKYRCMRIIEGGPELGTEIDSEL